MIQLPSFPLQIRHCHVGWLPTIFGDEIVVFSCRKTSATMVKQGRQVSVEFSMASVPCTCIESESTHSQKTFTSRNADFFLQILFVFRHILCTITFCTLVYHRFDEFTSVLLLYTCGFFSIYH